LKREQEMIRQPSTLAPSLGIKKGLSVKRMDRRKRVPDDHRGVPDANLDRSKK